MALLPLALADKTKVYRVVRSANATADSFFASDGLPQAHVYKTRAHNSDNTLSEARKTNLTGLLDICPDSVVVSQDYELITS